MRKMLMLFFKSLIIIYIFNINTGNYFTYNILNIFILMMLGLPGIIVIYLITLI